MLATFQCITVSVIEKEFNERGRSFIYQKKRRGYFQPNKNNFMSFVIPIKER
jgi:hypothetical protein